MQTGQQGNAYTVHGYCPNDQTPPPPQNQWEVIDIFQHNTINNHSNVAKSVDGVIIRCGLRGWGKAGNLKADDKFEENYKGFKGNTKIGYYFITQATTTYEATAEADYIIDKLIKGKQNDFTIFIDTERIY